MYKNHWGKGPVKIAVTIIPMLWLTTSGCHACCQLFKVERTKRAVAGYGKVMQELEMTHAPQYCAMDITAMDITK